MKKTKKTDRGKPVSTPPIKEIEVMYDPHTYDALLEKYRHDTGVMLVVKWLPLASQFDRTLYEGPDEYMIKGNDGRTYYPKADDPLFPIDAVAIRGFTPINDKRLHEIMAEFG